MPLTRPIVLVFHLIVWTQHYLKLHNCWRFQDHCYNQHSQTVRRRLKKTPWWKGKLKRLFFNESSMKINISLVESHQRQVGIEPTAFDICSVRSIQHSLHAMTSINVTYIHYFSTDSSMNSSSSSDCGGAEIAGYPVRVIHEQPLRYVYYTEADQIVRFDSIETLHAVKAASNATTYFLGSFQRI